MSYHILSLQCMFSQGDGKSSGWDFGLIPSERSLEAVGKTVGLHIIGRSKVFDLFPRTDKGKNWCVLWQKYALISYRERPRKSDIILEQSCHIESVVLMSKVQK